MNHQRLFTEDDLRAAILLYQEYIAVHDQTSEDATCSAVQDVCESYDAAYLAGGEQDLWVTCDQQKARIKRLEGDLEAARRIIVEAGQKAERLTTLVKEGYTVVTAGHWWVGSGRARSFIAAVEALMEEG